MLYPSNILCASCHVTHWTIIYRNCSRISRGNTSKCLKVTTRSNIVTLGMPAGNKTPVIPVYSGECTANQADPMTGRWRTIIHEPLIVFCFWFINTAAAIHCVENSELYIEAIGASRLCQVRRWWKRSSLTQDVRLLHSCLLGASKPFRVRVCRESWKLMRLFREAFCHWPSLTLLFLWTYLTDNVLNVLLNQIYLDKTKKRRKSQ